MVIERFRNGDSQAVSDRFKRHGRMLPEGVTYRDSWIDASGTQCFQLMDAPDVTALEPWIAAWSDLIDFECIPVVASAEWHSS
jgi:hypothetical protein